MIDFRLLDAAEACFEVDPNPKIEGWIDRIYCNIYCNMSTKNSPIATQLQHQKRPKMTKNDTKQKQRRTA